MSAIGWASSPALRLPAGAAEATILKMFPEQSPYHRDVAGWVESLGGFLWSKQVEFARSTHDNRYTAVRSCHDAGKSYGCVAVIAHWLEHMPDPFVVWTAPNWRQVSAIIGRELRAFAKKHGLKFRVTLDCQVYIGDTLVGMGRSVADTDEHGFHGIHAANVLIVVDEACGVAPAVWTGVDALMTNEDARCIAIGNPDDPAAQFAENCKPGSGWNVIHIDGYGTPNFTDEEIPEWLRPLLLSKVWVRERIKRWGKRSSLYISKVRGRFPKVTADTLISPHLIQLAQARELPGIDKGRMGLDVARFGTDFSCMYWNRAGVIRRVMKHGKLNTMETAREAAVVLDENQGLDIPVVVDVIGVGGGVLDRLGELGYDVIPFNAAAKATRPDQFVNLRAEAYWAFRDAMDAELIDLDELDDDLAAQLGQVKYKIVNGRIQIEEKSEMKKRLKGRSPDDADAAVMSWWASSAEEWQEFDESDEGRDLKATALTAGIMEARF